MSKVCTNVAIYSHSALADGIEIIAINATAIGHGILTSATDNSIIAGSSANRVVTRQTREYISIAIANDSVGYAVTRSIECCQKAYGTVECKIFEISF